MKRIAFNIKGIKCDNNSCDYRDDEVDFELEKYLNVPCPKCGSNLFTKKDYVLMKAMFANADLINELLPKPHGGDEKKVFLVEMDGSGVPTFKEEAKK